MDKIAPGKTALVFAGQGAQYGGMGKDLYERSVAAKAVFDEAEKIHPGLSGLCFDGTDEELQRTINAQPAIFTVAMAAAMALRAAGFMPHMLAGFSLGELAALTFAGAMSLVDGLRLIVERGRLMQQAGEENPSAMMAVLKLDNQTVEKLCREFEHVYPVNYNSPGQLVVAGVKDSIERFAPAVKQAGGRSSLLAVSGGFHCPLMAEAARGFKQVLAEYDIHPPRIPVYANYNARPYADGRQAGGFHADEVKDMLTRQIINPVLWQETIENMLADGARIFVEVGPGRTLSKLSAKIAPQAKVYNVADTESLKQTMEGLGLC